MYVCWLEEFSTEELLALTFYNSFLSHSHSDASWITYSHLLSLPCSLLLFFSVPLWNFVLLWLHILQHTKRQSHPLAWLELTSRGWWQILLQLNCKHIFVYLIVIFLLSHNTVHSKLNFLSTPKLLFLSSFSVKQWYCHLFILPC